jgi:hypothetical protein
VVPLTAMPCRIRTPQRPRECQGVCPQPGSSFLFLLLEPPRCYGSQLTRERWHTKMRRQPGLRIKAQSGARSSTKLKMIKTWGYVRLQNVTEYLISIQQK